MNEFKHQQRLSAEQRRDQILAVAVDVFGSAGYHGTSMNDIAEAAGVTKPVLYQHFDSKLDLYLALLDEVSDRLLATISKAQTEATTGREMTEFGFQAYFGWVAAHQHEFALLFGGSARTEPVFNARVRRLTDAVADSITPLIDVALPGDQRRAVAHGLVGMAEGISRHLVSEGGEFVPDQLAATMSTLAWAGLRAFRV